MSKVTFTEGLEVYYQGVYGKIHFVCENYATVCIQSFPDKMRDVCVLVYPEQYKEITLSKESTK